MRMFAFLHFLLGSEDFNNGTMWRVLRLDIYNRFQEFQKYIAIVFSKCQYYTNSDQVRENSIIVV